MNKSTDITDLQISLENLNKALKEEKVGSEMYYELISQIHALTEILSTIIGNDSRIADMTVVNDKYDVVMFAYTGDGISRRYRVFNDTSVPDTNEETLDLLLSGNIQYIQEGEAIMFHVIDKVFESSEKLVRTPSGWEEFI